MITKAQIPHELEPGFLEIFLDGYKEKDRVVLPLYDQRTSEKQDERVSAFSGFGYPVQKTENGPISYEDPIQMYDNVFTHVTWAKGFKVSREARDDDLYNIVSRLPGKLGKSLRRWEEKSATQVLERAFNTSYNGGDAKPLCSTVHPRSDGGSSQSNASSTGITLTEANYETVREAMRNFKDDKGMRIDVMPKAIVVPIELEKEARILFESNLRPGTADNDANIRKGEVRVVVAPYLGDTSSTAWYVLDTEQDGLIWFWRDRAEFKQDDTFETESLLFKARERFSNGFYDWRFVYGSKGDGAAYSS